MSLSKLPEKYIKATMIWGDRLGRVKKFALNKLSLSFKQLLRSQVETSSQLLDRRNLKVRQRPELAT